MNGSLTGSVNTNSILINALYPVYVTAGGVSSPSVVWPYTYTGGTVSNSLSLNPSTISLNGGQISTVTIMGGGGTYYVSSNSNQNSVQASIVGNMLTVTGLSNGSSVVTVCSSTMGTCTTLPVNTNNGQNNMNSFVVFSPTSLNLNGGQTANVALSGATTGGTYYISSNSNQNSVQATIVSNTLIANGVNNGSSVITVCSSNGGSCNTITVTTNNGTNNTVSGQQSFTITQGQTGTTVLSGGTGAYTITNTSGNSVTASINGNILSIQGNSVGMSTVTICSSNGGCTLISISVVASGTQTTTNGTPISLMMSLPISTPTRFTLGGGNGSYYLQSQSTSPLLASILGNTLTVTGSNYGTGSITVCSTGVSCVPMSIMVIPGTAPLTGTGGGYFFESDLSTGMSGQDVSELQSRLTTEGYFSVTPTGYFGAITEAAVAAYQRAHGISAIGVAGPQTRASLNQ